MTGHRSTRVAVRVDVVLSQEPTTTKIVLLAISTFALSSSIVSPATSPAVAQVDPVARAMVAQALSVTSAPMTMKTTIVGGEQPNTPAVSRASGTISNSPIQVNGSAANDTGYLAFKYGADGKGVTNYWVKTRNPAINGYSAIQNGDRIVVDLWQAGTSGQTEHVGGTRVTVDANGNAGIVLLVTGAATGAGDLFTVSYTHAHPSASYPVISAANAAAVALVRNGYLTATAIGFTVSQPSTGDAVLPAGSYAISFNAPGA